MAICFLVLSDQPRSGTSCVARILEALGIDMGTHADMPPSPWNRMGFCQHDEFSRLHERLTGRHGLELAVNVTPVAHPEFLPEYRALIARYQSLGHDWGVNSIDMAFCLYHFLEYTNGPIRVVLCRRPFHESVDSWMARSGHSYARVVTHLGAYRYHTGATLTARKIEPFVVEFDDLFRDPCGVVQNIADWADRPLTEASLAIIEPSERRFGS